MINQDLISVIIPAYNHERYVGKTINSLISQNHKNVELIIVNDGSTDNTDLVIQNFLTECEKRFSRFIYIKKENEGLIKTLNKGLSLAKGKYVYVIASDDFAEPEALETLHDFLSKNKDYGMAVGDNYIIDDDGKRCFWNKKSENVYEQAEAKFLTFGDRLKASRADVDFNSEEFGSYKSLLKGNYIPNGYLLCKDIIDKIGGYSETAPLEDYSMMMQISKISKLKFIDKPLFHYRWHSTNTMKQTEHLNAISTATLMQEENYAMANGYGDLFLKVVGNKKSFRIPYVVDITRTEDAFKERVVIRLLGIRFVIVTKTYDMTKIRVLGLFSIQKGRKVQ